MMGLNRRVILIAAGGTFFLSLIPSAIRLIGLDKFQVYDMVHNRGLLQYAIIYFCLLAGLLACDKDSREGGWSQLRALYWLGTAWTVAGIQFVRGRQAMMADIQDGTLHTKLISHAEQAIRDPLRVCTIMTVVVLLGAICCCRRHRKDGGQ